MLTAIYPFVIALVASLLLTPAVRLGARRLRMVSAPTRDRWHKQPTALLGGIAIFVGFVISVAVSLAIAGEPPGKLATTPMVAGVIAAAATMFITGLIDDRFKLRPSSKLIAQCLAAAMVISGGVVYPLTPWVTVNVIVTVFWFIGVTNALNLLDNMDGVAAGVAGIAAVCLGASFALQNNVTMVIVCAALAGASIGFLPFNFHPASIFMGDSGSLFLGALIASLGAAYPATASVGILPVLAVPLFVAAIPILDTLLVTTTRTLAGRPISSGGRDHTAHRLVALGLSERQVALMFYAFALCGGVLALLIAHSTSGLQALIGLLFLILLGLFATYLVRMHRYDPEEGENSRLTVVVSDLLYKRRALEVLLDIVLFGAAYYGAYMLRYDAVLPPSQSVLLERSLAAVVVTKSIAFGLGGVYRSVWQHAGLHDFLRLLRASLLGLVLTSAVLVMFFRDADFARSIVILDTILVVCFTAGARLSFRSLEILRRGMATVSGQSVLIYGAGAGGELAARELLANKAARLNPIGFIDDNPRLHGRRIHGIPVLGGGERTLAIALEKGAKTVLVGTRALNSHQLERLMSSCSNAGIEVVEFRLEITPCLNPTRVLQQRLIAD